MNKRQFIFSAIAATVLAACGGQQQNSSAPEKAAVGCQWAWVRPFQDFVLWICDQVCLLLGGPSPEDEHHRVLPLIQQLDHAVREDLPALVPMGMGGMLPHGQHGIEQQHPVLRPALQASVGRRIDPKIILQFLEDID